MLELYRLSGVVYLEVLSLPNTHRLIAESFALVNSSLSEGVSMAVLEVRIDMKLATNYQSVKVISLLFNSLCCKVKSK